MNFFRQNAKYSLLLARQAGISNRISLGAKTRILALKIIPTSFRQLQKGKI